MNRPEKVTKKASPAKSGDRRLPPDVASLAAPIRPRLGRMNRTLYTFLAERGWLR